MSRNIVNYRADKPHLSIGEAGGCCIARGAAEAKTRGEGCGCSAGRVDASGAAAAVTIAGTGSDSGRCSIVESIKFRVKFLLI